MVPASLLSSLIVLATALFVRSAPVPQSGVPGPVTFGQLSAPSLGETFDDFIASPVVPPKEEATAPAIQKIASRRIKFDSASIGYDPSNFKRFFPNFFRDRGGFDGFDRFEAKAPAKGANTPPKAQGQGKAAQVKPGKGAAGGQGGAAQAQPQGKGKAQAGAAQGGAKKGKAPAGSGKD